MWPTQNGHDYITAEYFDCSSYHKVQMIHLISLVNNVIPRGEVSGLNAQSEGA